MHLNVSPDRYQTRLNVIGVNHTTLDVEGREEIARMCSDTNLLLQQIINECQAQEAAVISTCNRFEIITAGASSDDALRSFVKQRGRGDLKDDQVYLFENQDAVRHLFRVASSLDSMVVGEAQILGQVKSAYDTAVRNGTVGRYLHRLFQHAFHIAKEVRADTGVAKHGVSMSYVAVKLAEQIVGSLTDASVLLIGSGEMAELCALHVRSRGCRAIVVANRTRARADALAAQFGGRAIDYSEIGRALGEIDIVISSVAAQEPVITSSMIDGLRRSRPLFLIDLGVPRNIAPSVGEYDSVFLYNVDDLGAVVSQHKALRQEASREAELLIEFGLLAFERWLVRVSATPAIIDLRRSIRAACEAVLRDELRDRMSDEEMCRIVDKIAGKASHDLTSLVGLCPNGKLSYDALLPLLLSDAVIASRRE